MRHVAVIYKGKLICFIKKAQTQNLKMKVYKKDLRRMVVDDCLAVDCLIKEKA